MINVPKNGVFFLFYTRFTERWNFHHCLGALDGKHIAIRKPDNAPDYHNYKGFYSIILLALTDANYRFRYIEVGDPGANGDAGLYNESILKDAFATGKQNLCTMVWVFLN